MLSSAARSARVYGSNAVLERLERMGRQPRVFASLVGAGFPEGQLREACGWFMESASNPIEHYAAQKLREGFVEDETLLALFVRYYECEDWKLEYSPWFFSKEDYQRLFAAILSPIEFESARLRQFQGQEHWLPYFLKLPYDLGMEQASLALWEQLGAREYFWQPQTDYLQLRAATIFGYLRGHIDLRNFSPKRFNYQWEQEIRQRLHGAVEEFQQALAEAVRLWQQARTKEQRRPRFRQQRYAAGGLVMPGSALAAALVLLGLEAGSTTLPGLGRAFRRLSKQAHPDHGGSPEAFRRLTESKELVEHWLRGQA